MGGLRAPLEPKPALNAAIIYQLGDAASAPFSIKGTVRPSSQDNARTKYNGTDCLAHGTGSIKPGLKSASNAVTVENLGTRLLLDKYLNTFSSNHGGKLQVLLMCFLSIKIVLLRLR